MPNAKVLESKKAVVDALTSQIKEATSVVFVDYKVSLSLRIPSCVSSSVKLVLSTPLLRTL